jgi:hypothetical protein
MRRLLPLLALAGLFAALAATPALAATQSNVYAVKAKVTPATKRGDVAVKFAYTVGERSGVQPAAVKRYTIGFAGLRSHGERYAKCASAKILAAGDDSTCPKGSLVGSGKIDNYVYVSSDPSGAGGFPCAKQLKIYNNGRNKATLFITGDAARCGGVGTLPPIAAKFVPSAGHGTALQFELPATILHPVAGLTVAVRSVESTLKRGFLTSSGGKHPVTVTFLAEDGQAATVKA